MVKILLDSASDCKNAKLHDYYIPISINIAGKEYKDGVNIDSNTFYSLLTSSKEFPKTSQPSPQDFADIFEEVKANGDELVYLCVSGALSGTIQSANIAKEMVDYDKIYIVDTLTATHCIHMLARTACQMADNGASGEEIAVKCEALRRKIKALAGLDTLEYLYKGGRLSRASAAVGEIANIKPILTITPEGKVEPIAKAIGVNRAISAIVKKLEERQIDTDYPIWSVVTVGTENAEKLEEALKKAGYAPTERLQVGSTIGTHVGPGLYGVIFVEK